MCFENCNCSTRTWLEGKWLGLEAHTNARKDQELGEQELSVYSIMLVQYLNSVSMVSGADRLTECKEPSFLNVYYAAFQRPGSESCLPKGSIILLSK